MAALFAATVGALVLVGWTFDIHALKGVTGDITMKANAAMALLAAGIGLVLSAHGHRAMRTAGMAATTVAGGVGLATFLQHLTGANFGIDELLFAEEPGSPATSSPGRMGPIASLSFTLMSTAIALLYRGTRRAAVRAQLLAIVTAVLLLVPIIGYVYGAEQLYAIPRLTGIALHTAISIFAICVGVLAARTDAGPVGALVGPGPVGVVMRRLLLPALILPTLIGYLRITGQRAGFYDTGFGAAVFSVSVTLILCATIWRTAVALRKSEAARRDAEDALDETESRFRLLADQAPVLIWVEEDGTRAWFNRRWYEFTGSPTVQDWRAAVHPDDLEAYLERTATGTARQETFTHEFRLRRADGSYAWMLESATPRYTRRGRFTGYVGSCIDITERKRVEQERDELLVRERRARDEAERASRLKEEFLATLSHELRTPLNAVLGWTNLLSRNVVSAERRAHTQEVIARNAQLLARLVEDLIDSSRIAAGHIELTRADVDLNAVATAAAESLAPSALARQVTVMLNLDPDLGRLYADRQRIQQVVWNLLSNAIKFNVPGGRVMVETRREDTMAVLVVSDTGAGIDPAFAPHLFERFRQADPTSTREHGGLGLGLSIARHLVQLHGGTIEGASEGRGHGATFTMRLPTAPPQNDEASGAPVRRTRTVGGGAETDVRVR